MDSVTILETHGLTKEFSGLKANTDIDFKLVRGKITALIGPNGAGKSTFVGMLCGRIPPSRGTVFFEGRDISNMPAHMRIGLGIAYTFQITSIFSGLSLHENVALAARRKLKGPALQAKVEEVLKRVNLDDRSDQLASDLSYGHQRILEIAMGLAQDPKLFILDEPTQGLAESEAEQFMQLIRELAGDTTILLIEHNMNVVMQTADFITVLDHGEILAEGKPDDVRANPSVQAAYLGTVDA
jgi:branched-chain amino acid transport system ATP-binding protein